MKTTNTIKTTDTIEVYVNMLGGFNITIGENMVSDNMSRSSNIWNLLGYIIVNRDKLIPQDELITLLWPDEETSNPANALKTVLYRTRGVLSPRFGNDNQLILSDKGSYSWNPSFSCTVDAEEFAHLIRIASNKELGMDSRMELYSKALSMYKGDFIPKLSGQLWVIPLATYYRSIYVEGVLTYGDLLLYIGNYNELAKICYDAIQIEPFDERIHRLLMLSLIRQGKSNHALNHYDKVTEILYHHLGVHPSPELRDIYMEIMKEEKALEMDLGLIQNDLKETACRAGAFYCEYGVFKEVYRLEVRRALRQGTCLHLALITVSERDGNIPPLARLNKTMDNLRETIPQNLRRGDVFCRYSGAQFALLLPTATYENGIMILNRIVDSFNKQYKNHFLKINYKLQQMDLDDSCFDIPSL